MSFCGNCGTKLDDTKDRVCPNPSCRRPNPHFISKPYISNNFGLTAGTRMARPVEAVLCGIAAAVMLFAPIYTLDVLLLHVEWSNLDILFGLYEIGEYIGAEGFLLGLVLSLWGIFEGILLIVNCARYLMGKGQLWIDKKVWSAVSKRQLSDTRGRINAITSGDGLAILIYSLFIPIFTAILGGSLMGTTAWVWALVVIGLLLLVVEVLRVTPEKKPSF